MADEPEITEAVLNAQIDFYRAHAAVVHACVRPGEWPAEAVTELAELRATERKAVVALHRIRTKTPFAAYPEQARLEAAARAALEEEERVARENSENGAPPPGP